MQVREHRLKDWFDRVFANDTPNALYLCVLERLAGTAARLKEKLKGVGVEALARRDHDSWSIQENVGHLLDLEPLWAGRLDDFVERRRRLREADLKNLKTHQARHNEESLESLLSGFRELRSGFVKKLHGMDGGLLEETSLHPRLGTPMRIIDLCVFIAEHDDHHLARINELLREGN
ncbi:MAG: DinB family protein [Candidatus Zixiibacteriota bacterium]